MPKKSNQTIPRFYLSFFSTLIFIIIVLVSIMIDKTFITSYELGSEIITALLVVSIVGLGDIYIIHKRMLEKIKNI